MKEILRAGFVHTACSGIYILVVYWRLSPTEAAFATWGCALGFLPSLGFSYLTTEHPSEEDSKKGVALVIAGSVLRYGIFLMLLALLVFSSFRVSSTLIGGLLIWIPTSLVMALMVRRTKKNDPF